jgi:hypothetical protein
MVRHIVCVNHLLGNTEVVLYVTLYLYQSFTGQYRSSIDYCTSHCICVNHLLDNTEVVLYVTLYLCQSFIG